MTQPKTTLIPQWSASPEHTTDTGQKAFHVNLDSTKYGTFAEIGAGQEVARWFFRVGGAAGTVAKTISAYDKTVSDAIYGPTERYVSRLRLQQMLDYEYNLLNERLDASRGELVKTYAKATANSTLLAPLAALLHRLCPGLRLM